MASCPKCHQPLDDDEGEYICCAGEVLQWRCEQCAKLSEGFAFPYGLCPHCGGRLQRLGAREVAGAAAQEAIRSAFEIELGGRDFYTRAAAQAGDASLADLFKRFAEMEAEHMATLSRRYHIDIPDPSDGFRLDLATVQAGIEGGIDNPDTLFRAAIEFERRAVKFFTDRAEGTASDSVERQLYRELGAEEAEHVAILETEYARWKEGKAGLL